MTKTITKGQSYTLLFPIDDDVYNVEATYTGETLVSDGNTYYRFHNLNTNKHYLMSMNKLKVRLGGDFTELDSFDVELG